VSIPTCVEGFGLNKCITRSHASCRSSLVLTSHLDNAIQYIQRHIHRH
jgi:hypothetical protein